MEVLGPQHGAPAPAALAAAQVLSSSHQDQGGPLHRRLLRFILGGLVRKTQHHDHLDKQDGQQQEPLDQQQDLLHGCSEDGTEDCSEDVLGMSPFASCEDLQDYRRHLQLQRQQHAHGHPQRQQQHAHRHQHQQQHARHQQQQQQAGPLRQVLRWIVHKLRSAARSMSPQGAGNNDTTLAERIFNVATSVPFVLVGIHSLR